MIIIFTGILFSICLIIIYKYTRIKFIKHIVNQEITREFNKELENRVKQYIFLESVDDRLSKIMLVAHTNEGQELLNTYLDEIREIERKKMLGEKNFGLKQ